MAILSNDTLSGCSKIPSFIGAGTTMIFQQTASPTSWTKSITHNNKTLRVVSGSASFGGSSPFPAVFNPSVVFTGTAGPRALTSVQGGAHNHPITNATGVRLAITDTPFQAFGVGGDPTAIYPLNPDPLSMLSEPGGAPHNHPITSSSTSFNILYVDVILAVKDA